MLPRGNISKNQINSYCSSSTKTNLQIAGLPGGTKGYPAQPGLIHPSVCPSVRASRLGIERKMAQAQQIRSIILQNHESMWIINKRFFEIKYINESKHSKYNMKPMIIAKIRETRTCSSSPRAVSVLIFEGTKCSSWLYLAVAQNRQ